MHKGELLSLLSIFAYINDGYCLQFSSTSLSYFGVRVTLAS